MRARVLVVLLAAPALAQSVGPGGITAPGVRIDASGIHADGAVVDARGVRAATPAGAVAIRGNGITRSVTCGGGRLSVQGNGNHLDVAGCTRVDVLGNRNDVAVQFAERGAIGVPGNGNRVRWSAPHEARIGVTVLGSQDDVQRSR